MVCKNKFVMKTHMLSMFIALLIFQLVVPRSDFFNYVGLIVSSASSSCRRKDSLIADHRNTIIERLDSGEIFSGKGKHQ